jgi:hypothetical protein
MGTNTISEQFIGKYFCVIKTFFPQRQSHKYRILIKLKFWIMKTLLDPSVILYLGSLENSLSTCHILSAMLAVFCIPLHIILKISL